MKRAALILFCFFTFVQFSVSQTAPASTAPQPRTAGLKRADGLIPFFWDEKKGDLLFELSPAAMNGSLLYFTSMASGVGSPTVFADRSSLGGGYMIRFRRNGNRVFVEAQNTDYRASEGSPELKRAIEKSFPTSVLAALPIESEENGNLIVKANPLIVRDAFGTANQLRNERRNVNGQMVLDSTGGTAWRLDETRSGVSLENTKSFPGNTEIETLLTFTTDAQGNSNQPHWNALTVYQHHSFVALPEAGYEPLERDPRVGYLSIDSFDVSKKYDQMPPRSLIARWRLEKKDPSAAMSEPVKPIIFYLDRAMPEPVRSATRRGTLWWNKAFEKAGFKNAVQVLDLPDGADPLDARYSSIQWTNRSGRGWSVGMFNADPRTGEILHTIVQMDSHRMRTVSNYWQAMVAPGKNMAAMDIDPALFAAFDTADPNASEEVLVANRLALLAAHEIGHVLGLDHNFVASTYGRGSVMDYFQPKVKLRTNGTFDLTDAYMQDVGSYDIFAIAWGYTPANSQQRETIVREATARGVVYGHLTDPRYNSYDDGPDAVTHLRETLPIRRALLANYKPQLLKAGTPNSELSSRLALIYMFHRYAVGAAVNSIGGALIPPSVAGDKQLPVQPISAGEQRKALQLLRQVLTPRELALSPDLWKWLPPTEDANNDPERFRSSAGYLFSPHDAARAVAEPVIVGLLDPARLQRIKAIHAMQPDALNVQEMVRTLIGAAFEAPGQTPYEQELSGVVQSTLAIRLMELAADPNVTPEVRAEIWAGIEGVESLVKNRARLSRDTLETRRIAREIELFKKDPKNNVPKRTPAGAPAGPPVG